MIDKAVDAFFAERKAAWLKKNIKASMSDDEIKQTHMECESVFSLQNWLPNAAKRAGQISISTHPCTFSHPSARKNKNGYVSSIIAKSERSNDGFLRSGNVDVVADALGNAAALDVYKFLTLVLEDGQTLLQHLEQDSDLAKRLFRTTPPDQASDYQALKNGFLAMTAPSQEAITSSKIKQVYFPLTVKNGQDVSYHQLSLLTASGILFAMRKQLDTMRFGDDIKLAREQRKANLRHPTHREISNLTTIGYGGTKPQNISVLNNQNGGKAHLLMSMPPKLQRRDSHFPSSNFFTQVVRYRHCQTQFKALDALYRLPNEHFNNMQTRAKRDELYQSMIDYVIEKMYLIREVALQQYVATSSGLSKAQRIWLCSEFTQERFATDSWLDEICDAIVSFIFHGYEKTLGSKAIKFSYAEHQHMKQLVRDNKEFLR
ncbi:type I-F CRISPR-associated protein Csy1 [Pseudoalteromonas sp. JBTF-M23]|uniref:Type I-F CRISPR-associated protein Csy1 n=1 Tax=Pseudoalteromonas caenipelagi TaxID=2726988 RepID=A0A849VA09_9GAMM|nr:type I-F CRISPR-associated protein Csy1 [Pseudoalteromonas caenipelagi]NOU50449.1 type I-F CRISPR-associated protein Csy1 [Pseudoalteromonas caenipelagi]